MPTSPKRLNALLVAIGSHGDVHPFVGLGQAMRTRGHGVTIAANPHFASLVTGAGFDFVPIGTAEEYTETIRRADLWDPIKGFKLVAEFGIIRTARPVYDAAVAFFAKHRPGEAVMVGSSLALGARLAQEKLGVPTATVHLAPVVFRSVYDTPKFPGMFTPRWLPKPLNRIRAELGLPPVRRVFKD